MRAASYGFTLIELMIVVAIIAILAAIAIPAYQDYVIRSQVSEGANLAGGSKTAITEFYALTGHLPPSNDSADLPLPTSIVGSYVAKVNVGTPGANGQITITYGNKANNLIAGKVLVFSPAINVGSTTWSCKTGTSVPPKYLPTLCRS